MTQINFESFELNIQLVEYEERTGSIKILFNYYIQPFTSKTIEINEYYWVSVEQWQIFVKEINSYNEKNSIELKTLSDDLILQLKKDKEITFTLFFNKNRDKFTINSNITIRIDKSELVNLQSSFQKVLGY